MRSDVKSSLTIVMYHYVRDLKRSPYPRIKGLDLGLFVEQLDYIQRHYTVVDPMEVIAAAKDGGKGLPSDALLLTFDDGYIDHYTNVFPILMDRGLSGMFFPTVQTTVEERLLDLNKVHFILASVDDPSALVPLLYEMLDEFRDRYDLESNDAYFSQLAKPTRWDPAEVFFIKQMLQHALPEDLRHIIAHRLFERFVTTDEAAFARDLYASGDQLRVMIRDGMYIGSHSATHPWMNSLTREEQAREIDDSLDLLARLGAPTEDWVMCYPFGIYDDRLLETLRDRKCAIGLTTVPDIADFGVHDPLLLPRLDTNDLPKSATAEPEEWTRKVGA